MKKLTIRQAKLFDVPAMARIERESFVHPWSAEEITRDVAVNDRAYVAVAEMNGEICAYADMWIARGEAQLYNIVVDPAYRGMGIGEILLRCMAQKAAYFGCTSMTLEVRRSNIPAINMYHRKGFRDVGVRRGYYDDNKEDAILMDMDIVPEKESEDFQEGSGDLEVDVETV